jgi:hypothetical protein
MRNEDIRPKTVVSNRGYLEQELIDNVVNSDGFQRALDLHSDGRLEKVDVSYKEKQQKIEQINISPNEITREIDTSNNSNKEARDKVTRDFKRKNRVDDVFPVSSYSYRE